MAHDQGRGSAAAGGTGGVPDGDGRDATDFDVLLNHELAHRIKNLFAVVASLVHQSARGRPEAAAFADDLQARLAALARAHDFVRPQHASGARSLQAMLGDLLSPYPGDDGRIVVAGDDLAVTAEAATPLALAVHELATNAVKYGALADGSGALAVTVAADDEAVRITWAETGGPAAGAPVTRGFGTSLIDLAIARQLRGTISRSWHPGLVAEISVPRDKVQAQSQA